MPWLQLIVESDPDGAEALAERLSESGAAAVTLEDAADQPIYEPDPGTTPLWRQTRVVGLFAAETDVEALAGEVCGTSSRWRVAPVEEKDWNRAWMDRFEPLRFGERLWIVPSWFEPPSPEAVNILLDPGLAFGTGTHPTTRLCLEWLDAHPPQDTTVVDYGCGSGILAIAAAKLGAARVVAVDNDPQALLATRENAKLNEVGERIEANAPEERMEAAADLLVANILAKPLIELEPRFAKRLRAGGTVVLSGVLSEQAQEVIQAYAAHFAMHPPAELEGWVRLEGIRK
jgi:ribosomal protein L11 methyltransferase